jgi:hypothetical protein
MPDQLEDAAAVGFCKSSKLGVHDHYVSIHFR